MIMNSNATIIEMIINFWKLRTNNSLMIRINIWSTHTGHYYKIWRWFGVTVYVKFTATHIANAHLLVIKLTYWLGKGFGWLGFEVAISEITKPTLLLLSDIFSLSGSVNLITFSLLLFAGPFLLEVDWDFFLPASFCFPKLIAFVSAWTST